MMCAYIMMLSCVRIVEGYGNGQVSGVCGTMIPGHRATAQTSAAPYTVTVDKTTYNAGDELTVTLSAQSGSFKGFLLEAQQIGNTMTFGSFSSAGTNAQLLNCFGQKNYAVSHTSAIAKTQIQSKWKAPTSGNLNTIEFSATFVQYSATFWVGVKSPQVTYSGGSAPGNPVTTSTSTTKSPSVAVNDISSAGCGRSKTCLSQPRDCDPSTNSNCYFMSAVPLSEGSGFKYEITGLSNGYVAFAFSDDREMGNDDVYICGKDAQGNVLLQHAFTTGTTTPTIIALDKVTDVSASLVNGVISCSFSSQNSITTTRGSTSTNTYYIFIANGPVDHSGAIQIHSSTPIISSTKVDLSSLQALSGEQYPAIVKAHGCLMLIAWMTTGSVGMLIARYLKRATRRGRCCGKDFWFVTHVFLMLLSVITTILAFILVFTYTRDWSGGAHPVLGCLVLILSLTQPIAAMFRCGPHHERRFIFNWAHTVNALAIKGLAVAAIFTGLILLDSSEDNWLPKVMGGFVAWEALFFLVYDIRRKFMEKDVDDTYDEISPEALLLVTFFLGNLSFLLTLLVGIGGA